MTHTTIALHRDPRSLPRALRDTLYETDLKLRRAHDNHLGSAYNLSFFPGEPAGFGDYLINNRCDPYTGSQYGAEVCAQEREAVDWLMRLWGCGNLDDYWGSVGASGTEGNLWGIYLGREALPEAELLHSADAHYSIPKAARIQRVPALQVASTPEGALDLDRLAETLAGLNGKPVILALTCGTTMKGAHDDIAGAIAVLETAGYGEDRRYIHVDGALNAMVVPFLTEAPRAICPSFEMAIDSLSTSGHTMIGTPMPCGVLVCRRVHIERIARVMADLRPNDTTLMGSRNGHAVLAIWTRLLGRGYAVFASDARHAARRAQDLAAELREAGVEVLCNPHSLTVVFPQPDEAMVHSYQLACHQGLAHAVVMPSVTDTLLDRFIDDYRAFCGARGRIKMTLR